MTNRSTGGNGRGGCPDPEEIAAHAERRLTPDEAARLDEHIASCADCYAVYAGTLQFRLDEEKRSGAPKVAFLQQPFLKMAAGVLLATGVALSLYHFRRATPPGDKAPLVAELARALGDRRLIEPRLTGGFQHGRLIVLRSGDAPKGLDAQPAAVLVAVARIRERAEGDTSPEALGALGVTYLVSGDVGAAAKALESATAQAPENARLWSDLAAAYLARANQADEPADLPKALESAEKAIALPEPPTEAWFNRALALEALHLTDAARKAWQDYLDRDAATAWADEARQHLEALTPSPQSSVEEDKARVRAALEEGAEAIDRLAASSPSLLRDYLEDELLPAWAEAHLVGRPDAPRHREHADLLGAAHFRATRDEMARDAARALLLPEANVKSRDPQRSQALGFRAYHEAERLYDLEEPSCPEFREAYDGLRSGGSPYAAWARFQIVIACYFPTEPQAALTELGYLEALAEARGYPQLLGRVRWMQGLVHGNLGELTTALERYRLAATSFQKTLEVDSQARMHTLVAEGLQFLGESRAAWRDRRAGLALLPRVRSPNRRYGIQLEAALACQDAGQHRTALYFATANVETARTWPRPVTVSDAHLFRAGILHALGENEQAASDLSESRGWNSRIKDASRADRQKAQADAVEGGILVERKPEEAIQRLESALAYFRATSPVLVSPIHLSLARANMARGLDDAAEGQLLAGIAVLEGLRGYQGDVDLRASFFEQASALFDEAVRFEVAKRHDPERALAFVERGLARQLVDSLDAPALAPAQRESEPSAAAPLEPEALRRQLPEGLALIYYLSLDDRLLTWVLTRRETHFVESGLRKAELSRLVAGYQQALEGRASLGTVHQAAAVLHDALVRPLLSFVSAEPALIFIPDDTLQLVAFASLRDGSRGRYLVEDHFVGVVPSGTVFVRASAAAARAKGRPGSRALLVGNPSFDRTLGAGLFRLPEAELEVAEIARVYAHPDVLTGKNATKAAFLKGLRQSEIVHFAGHAASRTSGRPSARLFLAPEPGRGDSGVLYLQELRPEPLPRTRLVVLAACHSGGGQVSRVEGALGLGRPFLAAGVPSVVASRWSIDDSSSRRFFVTFHHSFVTLGQALPALREAQLALLHSGDASLAHPATWAVFVHMGGFDPHSLRKGDMS